MGRNLKHPIWAAMLVAASAVLTAATASADEWNERTELTFTEPVQIPGATLEPGTYIFKLADSKGSRHLIQVLKEEGGPPIAMTQAVPIKRRQPQGDTILTFNPASEGVPAIKAWYYPGSSYGHEFVYPEPQARQIAERSKTIVLSVDVPGTDIEKGTLRLYDPAGKTSDWRGDTATMREWEEWQRNRAIVRTAAAGQSRDDDDGNGSDNGEGDKAHAPMMMTDPEGMRVSLDELESDPAKYLEKTVTVDAEVEEVYGPRLFTIDEPHWGDLDGEILVYAPSMLAALVNDDDRITITGRVETVALADIEREWGWFELDPEVEVNFADQAVLVATRIVGGDNDRAMFIAMNDDALSNATTNAAGAIVDPGQIGAGTQDLVGRRVDLKNIKVLRPAEGGGFFVDVPGGAVLVLPGRDTAVTVAPGDLVSFRGAVAAVPRRTGERVNPPAGWNDQIYVVAQLVEK